MAKIVLYDIESTNLDADFGTTLAFGWKVLGDKKAHTISLLDFCDPCKSCGKFDAHSDVALLERVWEILSTADVVVTWYGKGFDEKFLNTRMLDAGLPPMPNVPHVDLYFTAKHKLKLSSNRLASVQEFLRLPVAKTPLTRNTWRAAEAGDAKALKYIEHHCLMDVEVLEGAYLKLRPFVRQHPRVNGYGPCRVCGAEVQSRGIVLTAKKNEKRRVWCPKCGHWDSRKLD